MDLTTLLAEQLHGCNDIEWYAAPQTVPEGIMLKVPDGMTAFAKHGSGSQYALWNGVVYWIDSEGEQYALAASVDELVDALHLNAGALYDTMRACQGPGYQPSTAPLEELRARFNAAWLEDQLEDSLNSHEAQDALREWAKAQGRGAPRDLAARLVALRPAIAELRALQA